ncbi:MAG: branched-chain amino acid transaminase [Planctomycetota bacterium]
MNKSNFIWMNGKMIPWEEATVHVMSHALHYGSSVFEGIRCYETPNGRVIFRLDAHIKRLIDSSKVYRMPVPFSHDELAKACREVIVDNELQSAYIRPLIFRGAGPLGVVPGDDVPVEVMVAAMKWGAYLGEEGLKNGIDCCVSSWSRTTSASIPVLSKAGGHYLNAQLIGGEARMNGYVEGISVNSQGLVSEGSAENIFVVRDGVVYTPPLAAAILGGITRDAVITLAKDCGIEIREEAIPRELLYLADEIFFTGTAAEVTPVRSIDKIEIGSGSRGPITEKLQGAFFGLFDGTTEDKYGWLDAVTMQNA